MVRPVFSRPRWYRCLAVCAAFSLGACSFKGMRQEYRPLIGSITLENVKRDEFQIVGDFEGQACGSVLLWFIPIGYEDRRVYLSGTAYGLRLPWMGLTRLEEAALYNAIERIKGADFVVSLRSRTEGSDYWVYRTECVTVQGKAIRLRPDVRVQKKDGGEAE